MLYYFSIVWGPSAPAWQLLLFGEHGGSHKQGRTLLIIRKCLCFRSFSFLKLSMRMTVVDSCTPLAFDESFLKTGCWVHSQREWGRWVEVSRRPGWRRKKLSLWLHFVQERLPLFDCDTFEVLREREGFTVVVLLRCCQCNIEADMRFVQNFTQPEF